MTTVTSPGEPDGRAAPLGIVSQDLRSSRSLGGRTSPGSTRRRLMAVVSKDVPGRMLFSTPDHNSMPSGVTQLRCLASGRTKRLDDRFQISQLSPSNV